MNKIFVELADDFSTKILNSKCHLYNLLAVPTVLIFKQPK